MSDGEKTWPKRFGAREGRELFGRDPAGYHAARPPYPARVFELIESRGALRAGVAALEIGAGSGLATAELLARGVSPLTVVEPDGRFAETLVSLGREHGAELRVVSEAFEDAELPSGAYGLAAAATSFHWIDPAVGLAKVAQLLVSGGYAVLWWNVFGDPDRDDAFHDATEPFLRDLAYGPSCESARAPAALDVAARVAEFERVGRFAAPEFEAIRWTLRLTPSQVGALYATFSPISRLPEARRAQILGRLTDVAESEFGGVVERAMVTAVYLARRV